MSLSSGKRSFRLFRRRDTKCVLPSRSKHSVLQPSSFNSNNHAGSENALAASVGRIGSTNAGIEDRRAAASRRCRLIWADTGELDFRWCVVTASNAGAPSLSQTVIGFRIPHLEPFNCQAKILALRSRNVVNRLSPAFRSLRNGPTLIPVPNPAPSPNKP